MKYISRRTLPPNMAVRFFRKRRHASLAGDADISLGLPGKISPPTPGGKTIVGDGLFVGSGLGLASVIANPRVVRSKEDIGQQIAND